MAGTVFRLMGLESPKSNPIPMDKDGPNLKRNRSIRSPNGPSGVDPESEPEGTSTNLSEEIKEGMIAVGTKAAEAAIDRMLPALEKHFEAKIEAAKAELKQSILTEVKQLVEDLFAKKMATVEEHLRAREAYLDNQIEQAYSSQEALERKQLSENIVLMGVLESPGEEQLDQVKSIIGDAGIREICRMGRFNAQTKNPRPVLIKFANSAAKHTAFKKAKQLREQKIRMDDHLTRRQQENRAKKQPWATALRQAGWSTFWRGDVLFKIKRGEKPVKVEAPPAGVGASTSRSTGGPGPARA